MTVINKTFTGIGDGDFLVIREDETVKYTVSGTFVGTVVVEYSHNGGGTWTTQKTLTAPASEELTGAISASRIAWYRFRCTAYTSGSIVTTIEDVDDLYFVLKNLKGVEMMKFSDDSVIVEGDLDVQGDFSATGALGLTGDLDIIGNLSVSGISDFNGDLDIDANIDVLGDYIQIGDLDVTGKVDLTGEVDVIGDLDVTLDLDVLGEIRGDTDISSTLDVNVGQNLDVVGRADIGGILDVNGTSDFLLKGTFRDDLDVIGALDVNGLSDFLLKGTFRDDLDVVGALDVNGLSDFLLGGTFRDTLDVLGDFDVNGLADFLLNVTMQADLNVMGDLDVDTDLNVDGIATIDGQTTVLGRDVTTTGSKVVHVYAMSDFPTPAGGVITLSNSTVYIVHENLTTSDRFSIPSSGEVYIINAAEEGKDTLTYSGTSSFFSGTTIEKLYFENITLASSSTGILFNIDFEVADDAAVTLNRCILKNWDDMGQVDLGSFRCNDTYFRSCETLVLMDVIDIRIQNCLFKSTADTSSVFVSIDTTKETDTTYALIEGNTVHILANEHFLNIDPAIGDNSNIRLLGNAFPTLDGTIFEPGSGVSVLGVNDATVSGTVNGVGDDGSGNARFSTSAAHGMFVGQEVVCSGFSESTYNFTGIITAVPASTTFVVAGVLDAGDDTGNFDSDSITIISLAHGQSEGQSVLITGTEDYDGGANLYNSQASTFQINRVYTSSQTGGWDNGGLIQTDIRIKCKNNDGLKDGKQIGSFMRDKQTSATTINSTGVFVDMVLGLANSFEGDNIQEWNLVGVGNGEMKYLGKEDFDGVMVAHITALSASGTNTYAFRTLVNGAETSGEVEQDITTSPTNLCIVRPVSLSQGETVKIQVANEENTNNITIQDIAINIQ